MNEKWLIEQFQWLHRHPELSAQEFGTTAFVKDILKSHRIRMLSSGLPTGVIASVGRKTPGVTVGLRADLDALPIHEETDLPYASEIPGVMHACGHDFHTACMLGAALMLKEREEELPGEVRIIFQPDEEMDGGGAAMAGSGLLDDVQVFYAGHTYPSFEAGTLGIRPGPVMAAADRFLIRLTGRGGHAAKPETTTDVIPAMAAVIQSVQTIVSRTVDPFDQAVVSITRVQAGNSWNIIPGTAEMEGTVRTLRPEVRASVSEKLKQMANGIAEACGCKAEVEFEFGSDAVLNDKDCCERAAETAREMGFQVREQAGTLIAEDFSNYLSLAPGAFIRIGTGGGCDLHTPQFTADPGALVPAARFFATLAEKELNRLAAGASC